MTIPGVQKPHWRPWFSWKARWSGCSPSSGATPSMVARSWPSAWTASSVQDFTDSPSMRTVHDPQEEVSQPTSVLEKRLIETNWKLKRRGCVGGRGSRVALEGARWVHERACSNACVTDPRPPEDRASTSAKHERNTVFCA